MARASPTIPGVVVVISEIGDAAPIPSSYLSDLGVKTPSQCEVTLDDGIPSRNVAVLSLTDTTTITLPVASTKAVPTKVSSDQAQTSVPKISPSLTGPTATISTQPPSTINSPPLIPLSPPQSPPPVEHSTTLGPGVGQVTGLGIPSLGPVMESPGANHPVATAAGYATMKPANTVPVLQSIDVAGSVATRNPESQYVVGSQTLTPGAASITINGTPVSLDPSGTALVVGSTTQPLVKPSEQGVFTADGFILTIGPSAGLVVGTQTITPGAPGVTISGTPISLAIDGTAVVIDGSKIPVPYQTPFSPTTPPGVVQANGESFTAVSGSNFIIASQTLTPGGPAITVDGAQVSLALDGTAIVFGESAIPLPDPTTTPKVLQLNGQSLTAISGSAFLIDSKTLIPGASAITIDGTQISLSPDGTAIVIGGSTVPIPLPTTTAVSLEPAPTTTPIILELEGQSYTEISGSEFIIGSQTLVVGGSAVTINGTLVSLGAAATNLVFGTQTAALATSRGLGEIIMGGFSGGGPGQPRVTGTGGPAIFKGGSISVSEKCCWWMLMVLLVFGIVAQLV